MSTAALAADHTVQVVTAEMQAQIDAAVAAAPPLTVEQRARLTALLRPVRKAGGGIGSTTRAAS